MAIKGQAITITYTAWDVNASAPYAGDVNNHTCRISKDGSTFSTATNTPIELGYGVYALLLTTNETNCNSLTLQVSSSTSQVVIPPVQITFEDDSSAPSATDVAYAVWSDIRTYPIFQGQTPKGYFQVNPPITNPWTMIAYAANNTTYGDLVKGTANNTGTIIGDIVGLATPSDVSAAQAAIIAAMPSVSGLSTFDPATDKVTLNTTEDSTLTAIKTKVDTLNNTDISSLATSAELTTLQSHGDSTWVTAVIPSDYAKASDIPDISNLSTFDPTTDTVLIDATQAATMTTATGFATASDISSAVADLETYGDNHWTGGGSGGGATAAEIWNYSGQGGRTLTASPTDVSGLATKTDLSNVQTAITGAMPSTSGLATAQNVTDAKEAIIAEIPTVPNDYAKASDLSGLSTFNAETDKVTLNSTEDATLGAIKTKVDTLNNADLTGIATASDVSGAQSAIIAAMPTIPDDYAKPSDVPTVAQIQSGLAKTSDLSGLSTLTVNDIPTPPSVEQIQNGLATSANISALQAHGDSHWGISSEGEITVVVDADEIAEAVWNNDERTLTDDISTITAQDIWEYGSRTLTQYGPDISPDEPVGAVYCTPSDVERRWGINNVRQWADLENDGDNAKIQTQIDWAILAASERINSDLAASVYLLPFNPVPYAVRRFAATLAGVELYNTRAVNISRDQSNAEIRTALADYSNWITSVLSNVPIVGATLK